MRDRLGGYTVAWYIAGGLALLGALLSLAIRRAKVQTGTVAVAA